LQILHITPPHQMDGRVLNEALVKVSEPTPKGETETIEADRRFETGRWHQSLRSSRVGDTIYLDQGNGAFEKASK
jgi:hypothetical protein